MAALALGSGSAKLIGIASTVLLTRLYGPEDYAVLAIYSALVNITAPMLSLRYALAVPLPRTSTLAANIFAASLFLVLAIGVLLGLVIWAWGPQLLSLMSMEALIPWRGLVIVGGVAVALYDLLGMWATRQHAFPALAKTQVLQSLAGESLKLILGLFNLRHMGLIIGQIVSQSGGVGTLSFRFRQDYLQLRRHISVRRATLALRHFSSFPIYRLPSQILLIGSAQAPVVLSAVYFGKEETGQLALAFTALAVPTTLMADSTGRAYFASISKLGRRQPKAIRELTLSILRRVFLLSLPPTLIIGLGGQKIFSLAFGERWGQAGQFSSALAVLMVAQFMNRATVSYMMSVFGGERQVLYLNVQRVILTVGCFWIGHIAGLGMLTTLFTYAVVLSIHYLIGISLAFSKAR